MSLLKLFKRQVKRAEAPAGWVARYRAGLELRQRRLAGWLGRKTQYWNKGSWLVALALFILLFGGCCLYLCIHLFIELKV